MCEQWQQNMPRLIVNWRNWLMYCRNCWSTKTRHHNLPLNSLLKNTRKQDTDNRKTDQPSLHPASVPLLPHISCRVDISSATAFMCTSAFLKPTWFRHDGHHSLQTPSHTHQHQHRPRLCMSLNAHISTHQQRFKLAMSRCGVITLILADLPVDRLQTIYRSVIISKLLHASSAWWGFCTATDRQRLNAFIRRGVHAGLYATDDPSVTETIEEADDKLFTHILNNPDHTVHQLLSKQTTYTYELRPRRHARELACKTNFDDNNFITRLMFKDCY